MHQQFARLRQVREDHEGGFTLIELLVVIVILGILAAVVVFSVAGVTDKGQSSAQATDARTLRTAEEAFFANKGYYAKSAAELKDAGLLASLGDGLNTIVTDGSAQPKSYTIQCNVSAKNNCQGAVAAGAIATGGTMVLGAGNLAGPYNPAASSSGQTHPLDEAMFNGLLAFDPSGAVVPDLAASLPTVTNNGDGTQDVKFTLRDGVLWHDSGVVNATYNPSGAVQQVTNQDVYFSFTQALLRQGRTGSSMGPALGFRSSTAAFDNPVGGAINLSNDANGKPLVVTFHFLYPYSPLMFQMNVTEAPIIPQHVYAHCALAGGGGAAPWTGTLLNTSGTICPENNTPIGSGPFTWGGLSGSASSGGYITLNRNPNYFKAPLPYLGKVVLQNTATAAMPTALAAARGTPGSIDSAGIGASSLTTPFNFTTSSNYTIASVPRGPGGANCINTIVFNLWQPITNVTVGSNGAVIGSGDQTASNAGSTFFAQLPEYSTSDTAIGSDGLPGSVAGKSFGTVNGLPANSAYDNPILSNVLVRKALFEGFNRAGAAVADTGVSSAATNPPGQARMADSIYNSNMTGAYAPTTFPGGAGGTASTTAANADLDAAGWDGGLVNGVRTWGDHPASREQSVLGLQPGTKLALDISHFNGSPTPVVATRFISDMAAIGVQVVDRNNLTGTTGLPAWPTVAQYRNFQIGIVSYCDGDDPVIGVQRQYISTAIPNAYAANTSGYRDQGTSPGDGSMDGLWYQANRATTAATRTAVYGQIQALAVPMNSEIPISESVTNRVTRAVCKGLNNQNTGLFVETAYCAN